MALVRRTVNGLAKMAFPLGPDAGVAGTRTGISKAGSVALTGSRVASYAALYETQPWVYIVVNKYARSLARLPLHSFALDADGDRQRDRTSTLAQLMESPAPSGRVSPFSLKESIAGNLCLYGNAVVPMIRENGRGRPIELWPSNFARWQAIPGVSTPIALWLYTPPGATSERDVVPFLPEDVLHFRWWSPSSLILGTSPLEPLRRTLAMEDAIQRYGVAQFQNGLRPSGTLSTEMVFDATKQKDALALERLREEAQRIHGSPDLAGGLAVLEGGLKWQPMSWNLSEAAALPFRKLDREEVAAAYDMPPPMVGILDNATFSNIDTQHRMLYMDTLGSPITMIEESLREQLVKPGPWWLGKFLEFEMADVLRGDHAARMQAYQLAQWFVRPNEVRRWENLPAIKDDPEAERIHIPLSTTTEIAEKQANAKAPAAQPASKQQLLEQMRHVDHLDQAVRSRLGAGASLDNLTQWAARALEIGGAPEAWGPLLTELYEVNSKDDAGRVIGLMRGALSAAH